MHPLITQYSLLITRFLLRFRSIRRGFGGLDVGVFAEDFVADAIGDSLFRVKEPIALAVLANAVGGLAGTLGHDVDQRILGLEDFLGLDFDVGGLPIHAAKRLVDHHLGVGQDEALALFAGH